MGMLIPERALPELLAELQSPLNGHVQQLLPLPSQQREDPAAAAGGSSRAKPGSVGARRGSLYDIMAGLRRA